MLLQVAGPLKPGHRDNTKNRVHRKLGWVLAKQTESGLEGWVCCPELRSNGGPLGSESRQGRCEHDSRSLRESLRTGSISAAL
jgi:hypothetical protein